jgi:hypothetical protein
LDEEERRYAKMLGNGSMSEQVFEEQMQSVVKRRAILQKMRIQLKEDPPHLNSEG